MTWSSFLFKMDVLYH